MSKLSRHGTVEKFQSLDVLDLYRAGALWDDYVSFAFVGFRWPGLNRLRANRWRVDIRFRSGAWQTVPVVWTRCGSDFDASAAVRLRSPRSTVPDGIIAPTFPQRSPPLL